jgi:3-hydroxyisobutyrate dehydrogenase-like beta-hydroxyacid dehydrogenase
MSERVAFIGLGVMGGPMAGHLARNGHQVTVFNRTAEKASRWVERYGGRAAATPQAAADGAEVVFVCVGNDDDVRTVTLAGDGALHGMHPGAVLVDHTTTSAALARELDAAARGVQVVFVDAPVSGGQVGAEQGTLSVMCGGDAADFVRIAPLIGCYARLARRVGPAGAGQLAKMVNQISIAGLIEGLAEALHFARAADLDVAAVLEVISSGAARSWQMENRARTMLEGRFDFGFAVDWMRKDLAIVLDEARRNGAHLPVTALVDQLYAEVQAMGGGRWDTSSLLARLEALHRSK